jgi:16S rRNA (uracil1498-N3)-methyltransferase
MTRRYFADTTISGSRAVLAGTEAHHLAHVMRGKPGEEVILFDGSGREFLARIERVGRSDVELNVLSESVVDRELPVPCTLGVALPKGDRQGWLVEKAVELGIRRLVPLVTTRGVAQPADKALARLERAVIEAAKQCGRNRLMEIGAAQDWNTFVRDAPADQFRFVAHPHSASNAARLFAEAEAATPTPAFVLAVGPEGGLTDEEVDVAVSSGWQCVDLGPSILRVETAALYLAAMVSSVAGTRRVP